MKKRIVVKCKEYYWGFCRLLKNENDKRCIKEKCKKFKTVEVSYDGKQ